MFSPREAGVGNWESGVVKKTEFQMANGSWEMANFQTIFHFTFTMLHLPFFVFPPTAFFPPPIVSCQLPIPNSLLPALHLTPRTATHPQYSCARRCTPARPS